MGMPVPGLNEPDDDFELNSTINVVPLVDIMLVMLIIFLIAIPVAIATINVQLPREENVVTMTTPQNVNIAVDIDGNIYWNQTRISEDELMDRLRAAAVIVPQPEVHIRGDEATRYENVGRVVLAAQRVGIMQVGFITQPPGRL